MGCSCCPCTSGLTTTSSCPGHSSTFSLPSPQVFPGLAVITGGTHTVTTKQPLGGCCCEEIIWGESQPIFLTFEILKKGEDMY